MKDEYDNRLIANMSYTIFLGITIENLLHRESHMDQLFPKLCAAYYAVSVLKLCMTQETLAMVYYAYTYFHLIMNNDIIFWGDSPYSINVFRLQKKKGN